MTKRIYYNGNIHIFDKNNNVVEAMYVEDDKIKFIGTNNDVQKYENIADGIIDLKKNTVVPGFIDSHMHLLAYGESLNEVDLSKCKSIDEVIGISKKFIEDNKINSGKWLIGYGWNQEKFDCKKMLTKFDLDKISKDIPIMFKRACFHIASCNSKALKIADITPDTIIEGGQIDMVNGDVTGILRENAVDLLSNCIPDSSREDKKEAVLKGIKKLCSYGVTGIHTDDLGKNNGGYEMLDIYKELDMEGRLDVRLYIQVRITCFDELKRYFDLGFAKYTGSENFKLGSIKLLGDGSLGGRTAAMNEPYENSSDKGIALFSQNELDEIVELAHINDVAVVIHAIGDRTIDMAIESFEKSMKKYPSHKVRHGIIHCQLTSKKSLEKIKDDGIIAYIQPIFIDADSKVVEKSIGKKRAEYSYNWKTLNDSKVILTFGTDCPIESPNPYENIYCAVTRKDLEGKPEDGFLPDQSLSVEESITAYTINGAYASYEEEIKGSLEVGKLADFVVLSEDIFRAEKGKIKNINSIMTVKGGKIVHNDY